MHQSGQPLLSAQRQLLTTLTTHPSFSSISNSLAALEDTQGQLFTVDLPLVEVQIMQAERDSGPRQVRRQKLESAIERLEGLTEYVQECGQVVQKKLRWSEAESDKVIQCREEIEEEIQILRGECLKKGKPVLPASSGKELADILSFYQCRKAFPKNKTEALMLLNQIEAKIQQLQMRKAASFNFQN